MRIPRVDDDVLLDWGRWRRTLLLSLLALLWLAEPTLAAPIDPVWLDATGRPNASAHDALRLLADAGVDGLAARDYRAVELAEQAAALATLPEAAASPQPAFERELDAAMRHYLHDLHLGRVDPSALGIRVARPGAAAPDFAALLQAAVTAGRLPQLVADSSPGPLPVVAPTKRGEIDCDGAALHQRLVVLGDLPADAAPPTDCADATLVDASGNLDVGHRTDGSRQAGQARRSHNALERPP